MEHFLENPHAANRKSVRQFGMRIFEIDAGKVQVESTEIRIQNKVLTGLLDIAVITAKELAARTVALLAAARTLELLPRRHAACHRASRRRGPCR